MTSHRARAITTLSYVKSETGRRVTTKIATQKIADSPWLVRHAAINALRRISSPNAVAVAQTLRDDPSEAVRAAARRILETKP